MDYMEEELWELFERKVEEYDQKISQRSRRIGNEYIAGVIKVCDYGIERAEKITNTFPLYTLHDETHICNVMSIMMNLLGDYAEKLTRDEAALLVMSACCHDIGMSYSEAEKKNWLENTKELEKYLNSNTREYVKAYSPSQSTPNMTDDMIQNYLRSIHHRRVKELLDGIDKIKDKGWSNILEANVGRANLIKVCQSHGQDISFLDDMEKTNNVDFRFCAILLRLADILDFDKSRAPQAIYEYNDFKNANSDSEKYSKLEWDKHLASGGFVFSRIEGTHMCELEYKAECSSMQIEQAVNDYIDWVEQELDNCGKQFRRWKFAKRWQDFILPWKVKRNITADGYESGQYKLTLNQDKIMELFIGENLYSDPSVFVRELLQNAIDAVRTREKLDSNLPDDWKGQINIRSWMDEEGYHWFRIEDNGIGMTEDTIMNYFLKIGNSYYSSDAFKKEKLKCGVNPDYMPISRFGIGILSCFIGDKQTNRVEVSTKHFKEGNALRLSMCGTKGYYYLANEEKGYESEPMKGVTEDEKKPYLTQAGTVIAVRTNLYQTMKYSGFKEIVDKYVVYPPVAIHYDGADGSCDYITEDGFVDALNSINPSDNLEEKGVLRFYIPNEELEDLYRKIPDIKFEKKPELLLKCIVLDDYASSPYLRGAVIKAKAEGQSSPFKFKLGNEEVEAYCYCTLFNDFDSLGIQINMDIQPHEFIGQLRELFLSLYYDEDIAVFEKIEKIYKNDSHKLTILKTLERAGFGDIHIFEQVLMQKFELTEEEFNSIIEEIIVHIAEINGCSKIDTVKLKDYYKFSKLFRITYKICRLSELEWYTSYFRKINVEKHTIVAHNGIMCESEDSFFGVCVDDNNAYNLGSIVLLKDKYRPYMDMARNGVKGITLENAVEIELISRQIRNQGYCDFTEIHIGNNMCMMDYSELLQKRNDFKKQLLFYTSEGLLSAKDFGEKLSDGKEIIYKSCPLLSDWFSNNYLYGMLCITELRERFSIKYKYEHYKMVICITKKETEISQDYKKLFPTNFFIPSVDKNSDILTCRDYKDRCACNEYHPLSQFIINNGSKLNERVPGIFNEMLRILANEDSKQVVEKMNKLLEDLRKLPGGHFNVTDNLFLSEKDFVNVLS